MRELQSLGKLQKELPNCEIELTFPERATQEDESCVEPWLSPEPDSAGDVHDHPPAPTLPPETLAPKPDSPGDVHWR